MDLLDDIYLKGKFSLFPCHLALLLFFEFCSLGVWHAVAPFTHTEYIRILIQSMALSRSQLQIFHGGPTGLRYLHNWKRNIG